MALKKQTNKGNTTSTTKGNAKQADSKKESKISLERFNYQELKELKLADFSMLTDTDFNTIVARLALTSDALENGTIKGIEKANMLKIAPSVSEFVLEELDLRTAKPETKQAESKQVTKTETKQAESKQVTKTDTKQVESKQVYESKVVKNSHEKLEPAKLVGTKQILIINNGAGVLETREAEFIRYDEIDEQFLVQFKEMRGKKIVPIIDSLYWKALSSTDILVYNDQYFMGYVHIK